MIALVLVAALTSIASAWAEVPSYILGAGDKLRITVFGEKDLSGEFVVGAMGNVSLPLIGEVSAVAADPKALEAKILAKLKDGYLKKPQITVEVVQYRPFYILGNVRTPGSFPYVNGMTVLSAIALAGGYRLTAQEENRLRLALTQARENVGLLTGQYRAAIAQEARLAAERDGLGAVVFPPDLLQFRDDRNVAAIINGEERMFTARRGALAGEVAVIKRQISKFREEIVALRAQMKADARQIELVQVEIADIRILLGKGFARKPRLTQLQRQAARIEGDRAEKAALIARAQQNISEAELRITNARNGRLGQVIQELQETRQRIADDERRLWAATDVLRQTEAKVNVASENLAAQEVAKIITTRATAAGPIVSEVSEDSPVFPGDIIRIPGSLDTNTNGAAAGNSYRIRRASD